MDKTTKLKRLYLIIGLVVLNIVLDQATKIIVRVSMDYGTEPIQVMGSFFEMVKTENTGAFLGMGAGFPPVLKYILFLALPIIVLAVAMRYMLSTPKVSKMTIIGLSCIIGGGIGNMYDRIVYGSVTDFLHMDFGIFQTGIFNIADVSVMLGTALILIVALKSSPEEKPKAEALASEEADPGQEENS